MIVKKACSSTIAYMAVRNQSTDFPVLTCCVSKLEGKYRAVIGARPKRAKLVSDENGIMANGVTKEVAAAFASYVAEQVPTDSNLRGSSTYRTHFDSCIDRTLCGTALQSAINKRPKIEREMNGNQG